VRPSSFFPFQFSLVCRPHPHQQHDDCTIPLDQVLIIFAAFRLRVLNRRLPSRLRFFATYGPTSLVMFSHNLQMGNSEESSGCLHPLHRRLSGLLGSCRQPARAWHDPCLQLASENHGPPLRRGVPVEVIAKIVDEAILVQYAAIPVPVRTLFSAVGEKLDSDYSDGRRHHFFFC
jgi:hypothetical protein